MFDFLATKYKLCYRYAKCGEFLDDFRILRAYFKNKTNVSKIENGSFKLALRPDHKVYYKTYTNVNESQPYLAMTFFRNDRMISFEKFYF